MRSKLTQEELARSAKVTAKFVSQLENGHVNVSIGVLQRVVEDGLGLSLSAFFAADGVSDEGSLIAEMLAGQPASVRQVAYRLVRALLADEAD